LGAEAAQVKTRLILSAIILLGLARLGARLDAGKEVSAQQDTAQAPITIVVHADQTLGRGSPLLLGQNYGPWMNITEDYVADYQEAGVTLLRFPAGNWGDESNLFPNNLDDLAMLADALNAEASES
jgi:aryl-phospho-beta-D-glucosidase BglC (GH1 family)